MILRLSVPLRAQLIAEARAAFPHECCGLIEGTRDGETVNALALHPTTNLANDPAGGFEIDAAVHLRLLRTLRQIGREVVGCYHSHPNGKPVPSERDRACDVEEGFVWIIAALTATDVPATLTAFQGQAFQAVELAE